MAVNAASHNVAGEKTGPVTEPPPELPSDAKNDIIGASLEDQVGQHAPGRDGEKSSNSEAVNISSQQEAVSAGQEESVTGFGNPSGTS